MVNQQFPSFVENILKKLQVSNPLFLGKGGEGYVFSYKDGLAIKIYLNASQEYLSELLKLQKYLLDANLPFATPSIQEIGSLDEKYYTIEKLLKGISMEQKLPIVSSEDKYVMLKSYHEALKALNTIEFSDIPFGNILKTPMAVTDPTWPGFLIKMIDQRVAIAKERLRKDVSNFDSKVKQFKEVIKTEFNIDKKYFVHGDYYVNQVLVNENNQISAMLDLGIHSMAGDRKQDIASICFFELDKYPREYIKYLTDLAIKDYGEEILKYNDIYKLYYSFYFSDIYKQNPKHYWMFVKTLNNEELWKSVKVQFLSS